MPNATSPQCASSKPRPGSYSSPWIGPTMRCQRGCMSSPTANLTTNRMPLLGGHKPARETTMDTTRDAGRSDGRIGVPGTWFMRRASRRSGRAGIARIVRGTTGQDRGIEPPPVAGRAKDPRGAADCALRSAKTGPFPGAAQVARSLGSGPIRSNRVPAAHPRPAESGLTVAVPQGGDVPCEVAIRGGPTRGTDMQTSSRGRTQRGRRRALLTLSAVARCAEQAASPAPPDSPKPGDDDPSPP
jgi:hypothetical protein